MKITLGYAEQELAEYIDGGQCDPTTRRKRINEAVRSLLLMGDYEAVDRYCFTTCGGCFTLPLDVDFVRKVNIDCKVGTVHSEWYQFMEGAGDPCCPWDCQSLEHKGSDYPTFADLPFPMRLMAVSDRCEDEDASIFASGYDCNNEIVRSDDGVRLGETIPISNIDCPVYSKTTFSRISLLEKPPTKGVVRLYGYLPADELPCGCVFQTYLIGYYLPFETKPSYSRYYIPETSGGPHKITVMAKRKWVPLVHEDQILPISNLDALIDQLIANQNRRNLDPAVRRTFENSAKEKLKQESENARPNEPEVDVRLYTPETI